MRRFSKIFEAVDNAPIVIFRMFFGFLLFAETIGAICTGWVKSNMVEPDFTFSHIGFEWLQPLLGPQMYAYFAIMGILGICVMLGYRYKLTLALFTILWTGAYLLQKESYNNHYYLLILVCILMLFVPANRYASLDARLNPEIKSLTMPRWCSLITILQMAIVYFFATVSKLYPDWLNGNFIRILLAGRTHWPPLNALYSHEYFHLFISWSGLLFDFLIIPLLLFKRTRTVAFLASLVFHLFNSVTLQIGIFPFFALSFIVFFYPPELIRRRFLKKKPAFTPPVKTFAPNPVVYLLIPFFLLQVALPLRHWFIPGDVLWTEEGHRLSWRMMLRQRYGFTQYDVVDKKTGQKVRYPIEKLRHKQRNFVTSKPDGIWQMSQRIKSEYAKKGQDVSVFVQSSMSVNSSPYRRFIDPKIDMAAADYNYFGHSDWILTYDDLEGPAKNR